MLLVLYTKKKPSAHVSICFVSFSMSKNRNTWCLSGVIYDRPSVPDPSVNKLSTKVEVA